MAAWGTFRYQRSQEISLRMFPLLLAHVLLFFSICLLLVFTLFNCNFNHPLSLSFPPSAKHQLDEIVPGERIVLDMHIYMMLYCKFNNKIYTILVLYWKSGRKRVNSNRFCIIGSALWWVEKNECGIVSEWRMLNDWEHITLRGTSWGGWEKGWNIHCSLVTTKDREERRKSEVEKESFKKDGKKV